MDAWRERARTELRRRLHLALVAAVVLGLALGPAPIHIGAAAIAAIAGLVAAAGDRRSALALATLAATGLFIAQARLESLERGADDLPLGKPLEARATLLERPRPTRFGSQAALQLEHGPKVLARAGADMRWPEGGEPGIELAVRGTPARPRSPPGADFDWAAHLRRRGIAAELRLDDLRATGRRRGGWRGAVDSMRRRAEQGTAAGVSERDAALVRGMVLGQDERIDAATRDDFRASGLGHLLAVSGQNVMLLAALAAPFIGAAGAGTRARVAILLALIAIYVPLAGAGASLQRAGVMGAAGLAALAAGRAASRWYCLLLAAAVTLALNPLVSGDPGWQLSFAAVAGIVAIGAPLARRLEKLPRLLAEGLALTVSATLATAPLAAFHFGSVSLASLPANLAALPAVAPLMWIGMLQTALAQLPATGEACELLGAANRLPLAWLQAVARWFADLPGMQAQLPLGTPAAVCLAYAALIAGLAWLRRSRPWIETHGRPVLAAVRRVPRRTRLAAVLAAAVLCGVGAQAALGPSAPPERLTVSFLDVGQGDATLIQHPDGSAVLFDAGPPEARVARLLKQAGVRRLSVAVMTHASRDHHGGFREVFERIPVELVVDGGDGTRDPDFNAALAEARRRGARVTRGLAGERLRAGGLEIRFLSPPPRAPGPPPEDPNPRALVAIVSAGAFDLFLSADAESPSLLPLALPDVEAMKVAHHGSEDPGLPELLDRLRPEVAVIEVGENSYGHPAPSTLQALERAVPRVWRTDEDGTVELAP